MSIFLIKKRPHFATSEGTAKWGQKKFARLSKTSQSQNYSHNRYTAMLCIVEQTVGYQPNITDEPIHSHHSY